MRNILVNGYGSPESKAFVGYIQGMDDVSLVPYTVHGGREESVYDSIVVVENLLAVRTKFHQSFTIVDFTPGGSGVLNKDERTSNEVVVIPALYVGHEGSRFHEDVISIPNTMSQLIEISEKISRLTQQEMIGDELDGFVTIYSHGVPFDPDTLGAEDGFLDGICHLGMRGEISITKDTYPEDDLRKRIFNVSYKNRDDFIGLELDIQFEGPLDAVNELINPFIGVMDIKTRTGTFFDGFSYRKEVRPRNLEGSTKEWRVYDEEGCLDVSLNVLEHSRINFKYVVQGMSQRILNAVEEVSKSQ
jgi:hypothetical protein